MQPTIEIWIESEKFKGQQRGNLHKALPLSIKTRPVLSCVQNLYANKGAGTKGVNDDTADGFSKEKLIGSSNLWLTEPMLRILFAASTSRKSRTAQKTSSWNSYLYGQAGAGSIENDIGIGLRANLLKQFSRLSSQQELPHCAEIFEKRIFRCVVVY